MTKIPVWPGRKITIEYKNGNFVFGLEPKEIEFKTIEILGVEFPLWITVLFLLAFVLAISA